ncbi:unnamed protein product [Blepharisma stoltei]|uniref:C2H2-type domain-containing protein n=1 Tax=Blepharisma stoltei TaxID=1481888 RepID=A0AAU9I6E3_9CILI|nr:unnamed protein product [Blepharisma stoltei]
MEEEIKYTCYYSWCSRQFKNKYNLKCHINARHLFLRSFTCNVCHIRLVSKQNLIEHRFIHSGRRPYVCKVPGCGKKFRQLSQLSLHRRVHNQLPFTIENGCIQLEPIDFSESQEKNHFSCGENRTYELPYISEERKNEQNKAQLSFCC